MYWMGLMLLLAMTLDGCSNQSDKSGRPEEPLTLDLFTEDSPFVNSARFCADMKQHH
jgi:hypothetical protein